ncbi:unnamed protein product [Allacma fusca]|uniref:AAA+ ATPase domain-containing protein n=1 Tax=Allacma fusca TaxID=39272 RepID=A0A8J2L1H2_9HEXA|nr:unnamed protein product [Allacma fusca]
MQSVQNQAVLLTLSPNLPVSSWTKIVLNLHTKLKITIAELSPTATGNSPVRQSQPHHHKLEDNSSQSTPSLLNNGFTYYKSNGSFDLDKRAGDFQRSFLGTSANIRVSARTFKTMRSKKAEEARNPSLFARLKNIFLPRATESAGTSPDKLSALLKDLPPTEANKLKIAFAEGYTAANPSTAGKTEGRGAKYLRHFQQILSVAFLTALLYSIMSSFTGRGVFRVSVGNDNQVLPEDINVTFDDVRGVDEAKNELQEVVEFLRNPDKFATLGGKLPKGVLLVGPPGTGKTLLARAVAGEASVPFFHAAGPEFDEVLVGQGARRVRDLFKAAKAKAPCVIFIDEIDSIGSARTNSALHPYANQTINQLLSEMDGFHQNEGVIVLGATNRKDDLDKALLRPGRFDIEVHVLPPDVRGRKEIIEYYLGKVKRSGDVDIDAIARGTIGFTGADLENMINQAALRAAIEGADSVGEKHLEFARDKSITGVERKSMVIDDETKLATAYHEGGHALVAIFTKDAMPLHKVTIIPRANSLGHTSYLPEKEMYGETRAQLMAKMDIAMGGRAAEELLYGIDKIRTGAAQDLNKATQIATHMVKTYGMSEKAGLRIIRENPRALVATNDLGPGTSEMIDNEIKRLLQESYDRAKKILFQHSKEHKALAEALMKYETLDAEDVKGLLIDGLPTRLLNSQGGGSLPSPKVNSSKSSPSAKCTPTPIAPFKGIWCCSRDFECWR